MPESKGLPYARLKSDYNLDAASVDALNRDQMLETFSRVLEGPATARANPQVAFNFITNELAGHLRRVDASPSQRSSPALVGALKKIVQALSVGTIDSTAPKAPCPEQSPCNSF